MGAYISVSRYNFIEEQTTGSISSLGLFEVDQNTYGNEIEHIEIKNGLNLFAKILSIPLPHDQFYLELKEKLFFILMADNISGDGYYENSYGNRYVTYQLPEAGLNAIKKVIDNLSGLKEMGFVDAEEERAKTKYEETFLLKLYELLKKAKQEKNLICISVG